LLKDLEKEELEKKRDLKRKVRGRERWWESVREKGSVQLEGEGLEEEEGNARRAGSGEEDAQGSKAGTC
jgi:hypothetical protein